MSDEDKKLLSSIKSWKEITDTDLMKTKLIRCVDETNIHYSDKYGSLYCRHAVILEFCDGSKIAIDVGITPPTFFIYSNKDKEDA